MASASPKKGGSWAEIVLWHTFEEPCVGALLQERGEPLENLDDEELVDRLLFVTAAEKNQPLSFLIERWARAGSCISRPSVRLEMRLPSSASEKEEVAAQIRGLQDAIMAYVVLAMTDPDMFNLPEDADMGAVMLRNCGPGAAFDVDMGVSWTASVS